MGSPGAHFGSKLRSAKGLKSKQNNIQMSLVRFCKAIISPTRSISQNNLHFICMLLEVIQVLHNTMGVRHVRIRAD